MPPLVSVIIPTYNRAKVIQETLESVLQQTHTNIEIIVVDDGSSDNTAEVIAGYGPRVRYVRQENQGVELARSRGIRESKGEFLNFLDDDDLMLPTKLERQLALFAEGVGAVHCQYHYIDRNGILMETSGKLPAGDVRHRLAWGCFPWSGGPLVRRECFNHIAEDAHRDWYGDWGMWLRIALAGYTFACVQEPMGLYRIVPGSMTDDKVANAERLVFHILDEIFTIYTLPPEAHAEKEQIYAGWHFWITCRYYLGKFWEEGQRSLLEVLRHRPDYRTQPDLLLDSFYRDAISTRTRVQDPVRFLEGVFDHLPEEAAFLRPYRDALLARVEASLALHACGAEKRDQSNAYLVSALKRCPALGTDPEMFPALLRDYLASQQGILAPDFIPILFSSLPAQANALKTHLHRARSDALMGQVYKRFHEGERAQISRDVLAAISSNPSLIRNKGVWSIFVKSLPGFFTERE